MNERAEALKNGALNYTGHLFFLKELLEIKNNLTFLYMKYNTIFSSLIFHIGFSYKKLYFTPFLSCNGLCYVHFLKKKAGPSWRSVD